MTKRGKFIVFEGIDGSGKSTISKLLFEKLNKEMGKVYHTFEPTDSPIGSVIRNILNRRIVSDDKTIAALFLADRLDHIQNKQTGILQFLEQGTHVICDRYYYSSYAYHVPPLAMDWVIDANKICAEILRPDVVFFLDIPVNVSMERLNKSRAFKDIFETKEKISRVRANYMEAIAKEGEKDNVIIIDATRSIQEILADIWNHVNRLVPQLNSPS